MPLYIFIFLLKDTEQNSLNIKEIAITVIISFIIASMFR